MSPALLWARTVCTSQLFPELRKQAKHRSLLQGRFPWKLWPTAIPMKYFRWLRWKSTDELVTTSRHLWHTWGRNWKGTACQVADGVKRHKIWNYPGADVTEKAMGISPLLSHSIQTHPPDTAEPGTEMPWAAQGHSQDPGVRLGQDSLAPISVDQWYAGFNWAGG